MPAISPVWQQMRATTGNRGQQSRFGRAHMAHTMHTSSNVTPYFWDELPEPSFPPVAPVLRTLLVPNQTYLQSLKAYVGFSDDSSTALREALPTAEPHFV